jgi:hypothetical protein
MLASCGHKAEINKETYFLTSIEDFPFKDYKKVDTLTIEQKSIIKKYNLQVYIPDGFKSVVSELDKETFIFVNEKDTSIIISKAFDYTDSIENEMYRSQKVNVSNVKETQNDLSEFKHFKSMEKIIAADSIGPFLFGGFPYDYLGASNTMHQEFKPRDKRFEFGELIILTADNVYVIICQLRKSSGLSEDLNKKTRGMAIKIKTKN